MRRQRMRRALVVLLIAAGAFALAHRRQVRAFRHRNYTEVRAVNNANGFDYPVGAPNARGYYRAQRFGGPSWHLGEDWNGVGGGNSDYGDPVYAIADGRVSFAEHVDGGWGNVVRVIHPVAAESDVEAVYAHLSRVDVRDGQRVRRGQVIGAIGDADGAYLAHLHFEIRTRPRLALGAGYGPDPDHLFCDPSAFIDGHRIRP